MWIDEHRSEVLGASECHRLLALGAQRGGHGHLGIPGAGAPLVLPVNYAVAGPDVILRIGEGLFERVQAAQLVSVQVDGIEGERLWSVLVRGLGIEEDPATVEGHLPVPQVAQAGHRIVRIRADVVTGRRLGVLAAGTTTSSAAPGSLG
jgi:hypothetical protein